MSILWVLYLCSVFVFVYSNNNCSILGNAYSSYGLQKNVTTRKFLLDNQEDLHVPQLKILTGSYEWINITQPDFTSFWKNFRLSITSNTRKLSESCKNSTAKLLKGIHYRQLWALKILDATAKLPSGILNGNVNQFGDFDECLSVDSAQYCLAEVDPQNFWKKTDFPYKNIIHSHFAFRGSFDDPQHRVPDFNIFKWGICLPSACTPSDLKLILEQNLEIEARVQESLCKKSKNYHEKLTFGDYFARVFFVGLISALIISSLAVHFEASFLASENKLMKILLAFSIQKNWKELIELPANTIEKQLNYTLPDNNIQDNEIRSLHGIRALSALALLMCHKSVALMYNPYTNRTYMAANFGKPWTVIARTAIVYTDSFMLISGLLTAKVLFKDLQLHKDMKFKDKLITRIFRITPNLLALILFCTYILPKLNSGPLWPVVVEHHSDLCKQYMWRNLLFVHNYFGFENMCLTHTHQVGIDMQLFLMAPFLIYLWRINNNWGIYTAYTIAIASTVLRFYTTVAYNLSHMIYFGIPVKQMFDTANYSYILPSHRATIYVNGIILYYVLKHRNFNFTTFQATVLWIVALSFGALALLSPFHMAKMGYTFNKFDAAIFASLSPIWWGICLSWVIYASNKGYAGWFGDLLSWSGFKIFTRMSYSFYLVQFPVIFYFIGIQKSAIEYQHTDILNYTETTIILVMSAVMTLFVEMPFTKIKNILFSAIEVNQSKYDKTIHNRKLKFG